MDGRYQVGTSLMESSAWSSPLGGVLITNSTHYALINHTSLGTVMLISKVRCLTVGMVRRDASHMHAHRNTHTHSRIEHTQQDRIINLAG